MKAVWNGKTIAKSSDTVQLEGNEYFPRDAVNQEYLKESETRTKCPWKGTAFYYDLEVEGDLNKDAAWYYPEPSEAAQKIKGHVAFWKGVEVSDD
jgi:uncharacterized protein (DUF427 family)